MEALMSWKSVDSKSQLKKCENICHYNSDDDWISRLPDDILVDKILSCLPLKEAARTSILSSRWENLWKHTSRLVFDARRAMCRISSTEDVTPILTLERRKYIYWVSNVLRSHKGFALKEFKICFDLDKQSKKTIDSWLRHVFERRVERLELDFTKGGDVGRVQNVFPMKQFTLHQTPRCCFDFGSLRSLCFKSVRVTDQDIHFFLHSCPFLEHLVLQHSEKISKLNICGAQLALKHLEIYFCIFVVYIKVSAPNLTSIKVSAVEALLLENVPKLAEVKVANCGCEKVYLQKMVPALYCCLSQLEILTLHLGVEMNIIEECKFPVLAKLKKLEIQWRARGDESLIALTSFLRAAPFCQEFVIKVRWDKVLRTDTNNCNVKNEKHSPHQHLKVVKFLGYYGRSSDFELVCYLLDNSVFLEKLIIDPRYQTDYKHTPFDPNWIDGEIPGSNCPPPPERLLQYDELEELDAVLTARNYAKQQLEGKIPQHIELVIL